MDYKEKYEQALRRMNKWVEGSEIIDPKEVAEFIFPELKESDDERIRKAIKEAVEHYWSDDTQARTDAFAWLEKQGEQESNDKVEPKFKSGNWYLCVKDFFGKSVRFDKGNAYYCKLDGCLQEFDSGAHIDIVEELYEYFRLWTIQDAKDGDVLVGNYDNCRKPWIGIFKCISKDRPTTQFDSYCFINSSHHIFTTPLSCDFYNPCKGHTIRYALPATKEQRDLLFTKIKEAGYEWDAEKKELKKIEQKYNEDCCKISDDITIEENDMNEYNKGFECGKQRVLKYPEDFNLCEKSASAWSEEDEQMLQKALSTIRYALSIPINGEDDPCFAGSSTISWLKSLKERMQPQPKQEWSKEEKARIDKIIDVIDWAEDKGYIRYSDWEDYVGYVKSLRPQNAWKPSDEQLDALHDAAVYVEKSMFPYPKGILMKLYEQLKKLREE